MFRIGLNAIIGLSLIAISWKSTVFKGKIVLHIFVGVLVVGLGLYNGIDLYQKNDKILNLITQLDSLRLDNVEIKIGKNTMIARLDTLSQRLKPFMEYIKYNYPDMELDAALNMLKKDIESTNTRVSSLESTVKSRTLTIEQQRIIAEQLSNFVKIEDSENNDLEIIVTATNSNSEAQIYALEFVNLFKSVGIKSQLSLPTPGLRADISGVRIGLRKEIRRPRIVNVLINAFNSAKIDFKISEMEIDFMTEYSFVLVIGYKTGE